MSKKKKQVHLHFKCDTELRDRIEQVSNELGYNRSLTIREALFAGLPELELKAAERSKPFFDPQGVLFEPE